MAIGPSGPPPMGPPPGMGAGRGPDLPPMGGGDLMAAQEFEASRGGDVMAAKQRLMQIAAEAESILSKHPELAQELMGGGPEVGGMPQMPVAGNTGPPRGLPPGLIA